MEVYIDDMLVKSVRSQDHQADLTEAFEVLRAYQMRLNPLKCVFGVQAGKFLGFMVSQRGIEANPEKIRAILAMEPPKSIKEVQRLTGRVAAIGRFMSKSGEKCLPFFKTLKMGRNMRWGEEQQRAFNNLKQYLSSPPVLSKPIPGELLYMYLAASHETLSAVLIREEDGVQRPVYYVSKVLHDAELNYSRIEKLAFSLVIAARKLRPYFQAHTVRVLTSEPLKQVLTKPESSGRLVKWAIELGQHAIEFHPRKAIKAQVLADFIVECSIPESMAIEAEDWKLYTDGSSQESGSGAGIVLIEPSGLTLQYALHFNFKASNNEAEYEALIAGLRLAYNLGVKRIRAFTDSQLVAGQILGEYEAREERMLKYLVLAKAIMQNFEKAAIEHVPRTENSLADALSKLASTATKELGKTIIIEELDTRSIDFEGTVHTIEQPNPWFAPFKRYLLEGVLPEDPKQALKTRIRALRFAVIGDHLYKKSFSRTEGRPYLRCLTEGEAKYALKEVHEGACGSHIGARALARKILQYGYFWPTILEDATKLVKGCPACQMYAPVKRSHHTALQSLSSPVPFAMWGMDIVGPFPPATGQRKWLIVAVDYFTKWIEAEPLTTITEEKSKMFLWKNIMVRFGIPRVLITDNGTQFTGARFREFCAEYSIEQRFTAVAHPQTNGLAENSNKQILDGLKKRLMGCPKGRWVEELPTVLWSHRTTKRTTTGETPFALTYGTEALIPLEVGLPDERMGPFD